MAEGPRGVALACGVDGSLRELLRDDFRLAPCFERGRPLLDLFDAGSRRKLLALLAELRAHDIVLDAELVVRCGECASPLRFAAARDDDELLLVGAVGRPDLERLCEQEGRTAGRLAPLFANVHARLAAAGPPDEADVWEAFTRLYHDFARLQRQLERQNVELRRAHEEKDRVLRTVAHDLRSPLSAIGYHLAYLGRTLAARLSLKERESIERVREVIARMARLLDDLLVSSGPAAVASTPVLRRRPVALEGLLAGTVQLCEPMAERKGIRLALHVHASIPPVAVDRDRLQQVVLNLIDNALKFSPPGTSVIVALERREHEAVVSIRDEGPGVPPEERERVFEPYARGSAQPTGGEPSTGLGLAICRSLVEAHGGRIWLEGADGGGSVFRLTIPLRQPPAQRE